MRALTAMHMLMAAAVAWSTPSSVDGACAASWELHEPVAPKAVWSSVAYGDGVFVAVAYREEVSGQKNQVMTSVDGKNWVLRKSSYDAMWTDITYGEGLFVAVAQRSTRNGCRKTSTGVGGGQVIGGYSGNCDNLLVMTSADKGVTWTTRKAAADNSWQSVTYGVKDDGYGLFVAVANGGNSMWNGKGDRIMISHNGISWTKTNSFSNQWLSVTYGDGLFAAVGISGDGSHWSRESRYVGTRFTFSKDGKNWDKTSLKDGATYQAYPDSYYAPDGATIAGSACTHPRKRSHCDNDWQSIAFGAGSFVAVAKNGPGNRAVTGSADGKTWTLQKVADGEWKSVIYGPGMFVAVADYSKDGNGIMTSPDGITWTVRKTPASDLELDWRSIAYGNGVFVAMSYDNAYSVGYDDNNINSRVMTSKCHACVHGEYLSDTDAGTCTACPAGKYTGKEEHTETACAAWATCKEAGVYKTKNGTAKADAVCTECPAGTFCEKGKDTQSACPAATYQNDARQAECKAWKKCDAGTSFSGASATIDGTCTSCTNGCPLWNITGGFHKPGRNPIAIKNLRWDGCAAECGKRGENCEFWTYLKTEKVCHLKKEKGDYVDDGKKNCVEGDPCPASTYLIGTYQAKGDHQVDTCDAQPTCKKTEYLADFNLKREGKCASWTVCGQGELLEGNGVITAGECVDCPTMQFQVAEKHFEQGCHPQPTCNDKFYLANFSSTIIGTCTLKRTVCSSGFTFRGGEDYEKLRDDTTCRECDDGHYKDGTDDRARCSHKRGGCPEGQYFVVGKDEVKIKDDTECQACPAKTYKPGENGRTACTSKLDTCPPGEYLDPGDDNNVAHDDAQCLTCPAGTHKIKDGGDECQPKFTECGPGFELDPGYDLITHKDDSSCDACDDGEFKAGTNADKCQDKKDCGMGEFLAEDEGKGSDRVCEACPHGTYMRSRTHLDTACDPQAICQPGYYLASGSSSKHGYCRRCQTGTFTTSVVPHYDEECVSQPTCGHGFFYMTNPDGGRDTCEACPARTYMANSKHRDVRCKDDQGCEPGQRYVAAELRDVPRSCSLCEDETFISSYRHFQTNCTKQPACGPGQFEAPYSASLSSRRECKEVTECAEGMYETVAPTETSNRRCATITACDVGTYVVDQPSATSDRICESCPYNTFQPDQNAESEAACMDVSDCSRGMLLKSAPTAAKDAVCSECPNGQFQDILVHQMTSCMAVNKLLRCERNQYLIPYNGNATQDSRCEWCPDGTFIDDDKHTVEECLKADDVFTLSATPSDGGNLEEQPANDIAALQADLEKQLDDCQTIYQSDQHADSGGMANDVDNCATQRAAFETANAAFEAATAREMMAAVGEGGGEGGGGSGGTIAAAIVVLIVVVVGASVYIQKSKDGGRGDAYGTPAVSFSNPNYNNHPAPKAQVAYNSANYATSGYTDVGGGMAASSGYVDVQAAPAASLSSGYMDINPAAAAQSASYMDVQPSDDRFGGFESQSDEEEV